MANDTAIESIQALREFVRRIAQFARDGYDLFLIDSIIGLCGDSAEYFHQKGHHEPKSTVTK